MPADPLAADRPSTALTGRTVLVTGPAPSNGAATAALISYGAQPLVVPLVQTRPVPEGLDDAVTTLATGATDWLALTSTTAWRLLSDRIDVAATGVQVAVVGQATARAVRGAGIDPLLPERPGGGAELVEPLVAACTGQRVLVARGDLARPDLVDGLTAHGVWVTDTIVYRTVVLDQIPAEAVAQWRAGEVDAVLLASPSAVTGLLAAFGPPPAGVRIACIGTTTAWAAAAHGLPVHVISPRPDLTELVRALAEETSWS